ncbi:hypothetical protein CL646_05215 [bacterium]|nr:hypothetical protein [bacterium]
MKNIPLLFLFLFLLLGCSSLEVENIPSTEEEAQRILKLGLTHEQNLMEAKKLSSPHVVSVVTLKLINAHNEKIQAEIDIQESNKFADKVNVLEDGSKFTSVKISESLKSGLLATDLDLLEYYFQSEKNLSNGIIAHKLNLSIIYNSNKTRDYNAFSFCDKWNNCADSTLINSVSVNASNCKNKNCDYKEIIEINLNDNFLKRTLNEGFSMRLISNKKTNIIKISKPFLMGYLKVVK